MSLKYGATPLLDLSYRCERLTKVQPNSYLAITGVNIDTVRIAKKAFVKPLQKVTKFSITPFDFSLQLQAMTIEKLQFALVLPSTLLAMGDN